jgi:hypothetical protein
VIYFHIKMTDVLEHYSFFFLEKYYSNFFARMCSVNAGDQVLQV